MVNPKLKKHMKKVSDTIWEISKEYKEGMHVPARLYLTEELLDTVDDRVIDQITNVATLPGIQQYAYCMPDAHSGYGFPIGGVAAFDVKKGVISPGGIGFDINCGMRLIKTNLTKDEVIPKIKELVTALFAVVPAGVGRHGTVIVTDEELRTIMKEGAQWAVKKDFGTKDDLKNIESGGKLSQADPSKVSDKAIRRGSKQLGTLGAGNHYLEIQYASDIFDEETAKVFGIEHKDQVVVMVHCGSRGFGHQIATDYLKIFLDAMKRYDITVHDKELSCAPFTSPEGQDYYKAMACAANFAFANRQIILHRIRQTFEKVFDRTTEELDMKLVYDVSHNIAKIETYTINGKDVEVVVHRKGSTRSFGPGSKELPEAYRNVGQPVIIGGSMETGSWLLVGTKDATETFGSTMHGAGRIMSRTQARRENDGDTLRHSMHKKGIYVKAVSTKGLAEEAGNAYKNVDDIVNVMDKAGISRKVAKLVPLGNVKG